MHAITNWFIRNPVAANLLMLFILVSGVLSLFNLRIEGFPKIPPDSVIVSTILPGASTAQMDSSVAQKIEQSLEGIAGVKRISSFSAEGFAEVQIKKTSGHSLEQLEKDIKNRIDSIDNLPQNLERPRISRNEFKFPAMIVQLYGNEEQDVLQKQAKKLKRKLSSRSEITQIREWGTKSQAINLSIDHKTMRLYGLTLQDIANAINQHSLLYRVGSLDTAAGEVQIKSDHQAQFLREFQAIPIHSSRDGRQVLLAEVATLEDGFEDADGEVRFQGLPAIGMEIVISNKDNLLHTNKAVEEVIEEFKASLPDHLSVAVWANQSDYIKDRLTLLKDNAFQGLLLVFILLALFLNLKLAFWVALGIPVAITGTLAVMGLDQFAYSLNDITTFGMIVVLGILVDDAVVVGESVFSERQQNAGSTRVDPIKATQIGVARVSTATIFGVLTTVAAFSPILLIDNPLGKVIGGFSMIVIIALLFSLVESKFILPAHLSQTHFNEITPKNLLSKSWIGLKQILENALQGFIQNIYTPALVQALKHRYAVLISFIALAVLSTGLLFTGTVKTTFFPDIPGNYIKVTLELKSSAPYHLTQTHTRHIENTARDLNKQLHRDAPEFEAPIIRIMAAVTDTTSAEIYAELRPPQNRAYETLEILKQWRTKVGQMEAVESIDYSGTESTGGGFALQLAAADRTILTAGVNQLSAALSTQPGVFDVRNDLIGSRSQLQVTLKPGAYALGFSQASLASQLGDQFGGLELPRIQRDGEELKIILKNPLSDRDQISDLQNRQLQSNHGTWFPLSQIANLEFQSVNNHIWRRDRERAALIYANVDKSQTSPAVIMAQLEPLITELQSSLPQLHISAAGEFEEEQEIQGGLKKAFVLTLLLIYILMAIPLKSYAKPVIIMSVIPFGLGGAIVGHLIMDLPVSLLSFFGMLALSGIVVNDSLVLLTRYNDFRDEGLEHSQALIQAGQSRFRAIFLTTVTTALGLTPLMMETSEQAQYLIPAAVSLAYGEIFATLITLILVPVVTLIGVDIATLFKASSHNQADIESGGGASLVSTQSS